MEDTDKVVRGTPLELRGEMDPRGIREVVIEFESGGEDVFKPKQREEFGSYELMEMTTYLKEFAHQLRKDR